MPTGADIQTVTQSDRGWDRCSHTDTNTHIHTRREEINGKPPTSGSSHPTPRRWDYHVEWYLIRAAEIHAALPQDLSSTSALCDRRRVWFMTWLWETTVVSWIKVTAQNEIVQTPIDMGRRGLRCRWHLVTCEWNSWERWFFLCTLKYILKYV